MRGSKQNQAVTISADTYRRLVLLTILGSFSNGCSGAKRLQQVTCISERDLDAEKPFAYNKCHFGQYGEQLETMKGQLI